MKKSVKPKSSLGLNIFLYSILGVIIIGSLYFANVAYRNAFADMTLDAWTEDCKFKFYKLNDGSPQKILLNDLEGVIEDQYTYSKTNYNIGCQQLLTHRSLFKQRYVWLGVGVGDKNGGSVAGFLSAGLVVVVVILVMIMVIMIVGKNDYKEDDEGDDDDTYY